MRGEERSCLREENPGKERWREEKLREEKRGEGMRGDIMIEREGERGD